MTPFIPHKGDFIVLSFDPQSGHEQRGRRPALVLSNVLFNQSTGMCIACPITNTHRDYPFHVPIPGDAGVTGSVTVDQVKSIDYRARDARRIGQAPTHVLDEALAILDAIIY